MSKYCTEMLHKSISKSNTKVVAYDLRNETQKEHFGVNTMSVVRPTNANSPHFIILAPEPRSRRSKGRVIFNSEISYFDMSSDTETPPLSQVCRSKQESCTYLRSWDGF